ncbi:protocatechuate 3,4-dioxygenase subunit beta, partial [Alphaproteobacteria bacterium]|nr:protocatechuate 3,4-dioxygenase subunit beta [Alphaproteobacteria bacterium]
MVEALIKRNLKIHPQLNFPDYKSSVLRAPKNKKISLSSTSTELSGPIFNKKIIGKLDNDLTLNFSKNNILPIGHK